MLKKINLLLIFCGVLWVSCRAQPLSIDSVDVPSAAMKRAIKTVVVLPKNAQKNDTSTRFSTVFMLHGWSGNAGSWLKDAPQLVEIATQYQMILVIPDGGYDSWWWDSPLVADYRYETFLSKELIDFVDKKYPTRPFRQARAITGLSMGGHGAWFNAIRHQDVFGAAGSICGGVDIRPFPDSWGMKRHLGEQAEQPNRWNDFGVTGQLHLLKKNNLKLIFDCGTDDFFLAVNRKLHDELLYRNIPHEYTERPGGHNRDYWANAILHQLLFFKTFFDVKK